jgi:hypothetical protein
MTGAFQEGTEGGQTVAGANVLGVFDQGGQAHGDPP